jgi:RsiW-degrading membrane proteinase PrsW (M82 family)
MDILVVIAALPVVLICMYVYKKDIEREPKKLLTKLMLWGVFSIIPVIIVELILDNFFRVTGTECLLLTFLYCFVGVGLVEEFAKWFISYKVVYKDKDFNETYDAIVYSVFTSLGFALIENIMYVLSNGFLTGVLRAVTAVPVHTATGIVMGYFMGLAKKEDINNNQRKSNNYMLLSLLVPIIMHTMYDSLAFDKTSDSLLPFITFTIILYIIGFVTIKKVSKNNLKFNNDCLISNVSYKYTIRNILLITIGIIVCSILIGVFL